MAPTAGEAATARSWRLLGTLTAVTAVWMACGPGPGDDGVPGASEVVGEVLAQVGPGVVLPALERFEASAEALATAVTAWEAAVGTDGAAGALDAAREAFEGAVLAWQACEMHLLGPAASSLSAVGGADRRDQVYSWPVDNPCRVDQVTAAGEHEALDFLDGARPNTLGLDALEHLLFADGANACPPQVVPNSDGAWEALGEAGVVAARADYAALLAAAVAEEAGSLVRAWSPDGEDFSGEVARAGQDSVYASTGEALDAVFAAMFKIYTGTLHQRIETPQGLRTCQGAGCLEETELRLSGLSNQAIAANVAGARALFTGGDGPGLDDLLADQGRADLRDALLAAFDASAAAAEALTVPIDAAIQASDPALPPLVYALNDLGRLLKTDLATALVLTVPTEAAGDND